MLFKKQKPYLRVGRIIYRLGFRRFYYGERRYSWLRERSPFFIRDRINPHICITGESGSGKSNACKSIIKALVKEGAHVAVIDPHSEYLGIADLIGAEVYDAERNGINLFELGRMSEREKASELLKLFRRTFRLGEVQAYTLYKCMLYTYKACIQQGREPGIKSLLFTIKVFEKHANPKELQILQGLEKRMELLDSSHFYKACSIGKIMESNSIIMVSSLHTPEAQSLYMEGFLRMLYAKMLSTEKSQKPRFYVVIDEAEKLSNSDFLARLAMEGRKYGLGVIAVSQSAKSIDRELRNNSSVFAAFYQREPEELNYLANLLSGGAERNRFAEMKAGIRNLQRGSAVVLDSSLRDPVIVQFERCEEMMASSFNSLLELSRNCIKSGELLSGMAALGFSREYSISRAKGMLRNGTMCQYLLDRSHGEYAGNWLLSMPKNSAEHDVSVNLISKHLSANGIKNEVYNSSYGPDIIAGRNAIEYETGMKSTESTARMISLRQKRYANVIIITNPASKGRYSGMCAAMTLMEFLALNREELLRRLTQ